MKIRISYQQGEEMAAQLIEETACAAFENVCVRKSCRKPPFTQIYLTLTLPKKKIGRFWQ